MDLFQFEKGVNRLRDVYGDRFYPDERVKVLWQEVKDLPDSWFDSVVTRFIAEHDRAPMIPQFREEISKYRERVHYAQKREHKEDALEFWSSFEGEDLHTICENIRKIAEGKATEQDKAKFQELLNSTERKP